MALQINVNEIHILDKIELKQHILLENEIEESIKKLKFDFENKDFEDEL